MRGALDLLVPPACAICRAPGPLLCIRCMESLTLLDGPGCSRCGRPAVRPVEDCPACRGRRLGFASAAAALRYDDDAGRALVHGLKDGGLRGLAAPAAGLMALVIPRPDADLLTWVPADPVRRAMRGYHPPQLLAEQLSAWCSWTTFIRLARPFRPPRGRFAGRAQNPFRLSRLLARTTAEEGLSTEPDDG